MSAMNEYKSETEESINNSIKENKEKNTIINNYKKEAEEKSNIINSYKRETEEINNAINPLSLTCIGDPSFKYGYVNLETHFSTK